MIRVWKYAIALMLMFLPSVSDACTAVIISGKKTADGRPVLWKHRDTDCLDNSIRHFSGEKYAFTGLVNSDSGGGEVWIGANTAGFAIMNTASYCLKDDDVPASRMDREGILMYRALEICETLEDFEHFLDTLAKPMGVEANFGCIDAHGGAAWYETGNFTWYKRDVNSTPCGYIVVTNFSVNGDRDRWKGYERWMTAGRIFKDMDGRGELDDIHPLTIMDSLSRSYRHELMGIDLVRDADGFLSEATGFVPDQDFIPRRSTASSVVIHGVADGGDPLTSVLWAALGYPAVAVMVPVPVSEDDHVPAFMSGYPYSGQETFCGTASVLRDLCEVFPGGMSNLSEYIYLGYVLRDTGRTRSSLACCREAEANIKSLFTSLYNRFFDGEISAEVFYEEYGRISMKFPGIYREAFRCYLDRDEAVYAR